MDRADQKKYKPNIQCPHCERPLPAGFPRPMLIVPKRLSVECPNCSKIFPVSREALKAAQSRGDIGCLLPIFILIVVCLALYSVPFVLARLTDISLLGSYSEGPSPEKIEGWIVDKATNRHAVVVDRTKYYQPTPGSLTQLVRFGVGHFEYAFEVFIADPSSRKISKVARIEGYSLLHSSLLGFDGNTVTMELLTAERSRRDGRRWELTTFEIAPGDIVKEVPGTTREERVGYTSARGLTRPPGDPVVKLNQSGELVWANLSPP